MQTTNVHACLSKFLFWSEDSLASLAKNICTLYICLVFGVLFASNASKG